MSDTPAVRLRELSAIATVLLWAGAGGPLLAQSHSAGVQPLVAEPVPHRLERGGQPKARFTATQGEGATVLLDWMAVPGAQAYRLEGTGLPDNGIAVTTTSLTIPGLEPGQATWRVTPILAGQVPDSQASATATVKVETPVSSESGATETGRSN